MAGDEDHESRNCRTGPNDRDERRKLQRCEVATDEDDGEDDGDIDADDDIRKLHFKIAYIEQTLAFLDSVLRQINNRSFQIKNAIEWEKFKNGF